MFNPTVFVEGIDGNGSSNDIIKILEESNCIVLQRYELDDLCISGSCLVVYKSRLQLGQTVDFSNQGPIHFLWKMWWQTSSYTLSPFFVPTKQIEHVSSSPFGLTLLYVNSLSLRISSLLSPVYFYFLATWSIY